MLTQKSDIEIKMSENRCKKFFRMCLGGIIGATSGILMPVAQWFLNIRDKVNEQQPANRVRWPAVLDIGASGVVAYGAIVRFGNPALWCIVLVEGCLSIYGFIRGIQITRKSKILDVPKKLWNVESPYIMPSISPPITPDVSNESPPLNKSYSTRFCHLISGSFFGIGASITMPSVQSFNYILNAKRRWPPLINGGVLTYYALYVGSIYIGPEVSLVLLQRMGQALGIYGIIRGGYIGYKETPTKVFTMMWQGGINHSTISTIVKPIIKAEEPQSLELERVSIAK